ncbi:MAG: type II secretion system F family protein [Lachnospiraceae bacterium]|nr:type II secretion system F family protein [Lachnospiraceae bacterium]
METFKYTAISKGGERVSGVVEGFNEMDAATRIRDSCNVILKLEAENKKNSIGILNKDIGGKKLDSKAFIVMCSQFAIILNSGVPIARAVELIEDKMTDKTLKHLLGRVLEDVEAGRTLSNSFEENGGSFLPPTFVETIRAGEESGDVGHAFETMHEHFDKEEKMRTKIKGALAYPIFVLLIAVVVVMVIMIKVVPTFIQVFDSTEGEMPVMMQMLIGMSNFFSKYFLVIIAVIAALFLAYKIYSKTETGKMKTAQLALKIPMFGNISRLNSARQFANSMATMLGAGLPVVKALSITARVISNYYVSTEVGKLTGKIEEGKTLGDSMKEAGILPDILTDMTAVGESTGEMEGTLKTIGAYYDTETENAIAALVRKIEPTMLIVIGIVGGFIVIATYGSMFSMYGSM